MTFRIAIAGAGDYLRRQFADLLRASGFAVDLLLPGMLRTAFDQRSPAYEVIIAGTDVAAEMGETTLLELPLVHASYFIFEETDDCSAVAPSFLLRKCMSQEDIIARLNGAIYQNLCQRRSTRIKVNLPVEYLSLGILHQSSIQDLSENGMFIKALSPLPDGSAVQLTFVLPGRDHRINARGRTAYSIRCNLDGNIIAHPASLNTSIIALPGMGVIFEALLPEDRDAIRDFLIQHQ